MSSHTASACVDIETSGKDLLLHRVISCMCFHMSIVSKTSFMPYIKAEKTYMYTYPIKGCTETYGLLLLFPVSLLCRRSRLVSMYPDDKFVPKEEGIHGIASKLK